MTEFCNVVHATTGAVLWTVSGETAEEARKRAEVIARGVTAGGKPAVVEGVVNRHGAALAALWDAKTALDRMHQHDGVVRELCRADCAQAIADAYARVTAAIAALEG